MLISKLYYFLKIFPLYLTILFNFSKPVIYISSTNYNFDDNKAKTAYKKTNIIFFNRSMSEPELERIFIAYGLVNVGKLDTTIIIDLKYAQTNNFLGRNLYGELKSAYLQKDVAEKLIKASQILHSINPDLRLVLLDAARPLSIQKQMWVDIKLPNGEKEKFVANPEIGSLHNYGAAVDVTLADKQGNYLDMGTEYDSFDEKAFTINENYLLLTGKLTQKQIQNRQLLRKVMTQAGFYPIETEWWHFNSCSRKYAKEHYPIIISHIYSENPYLLANVNNTAIKEIKTKICFKIQILSSSKKYKGNEQFFKGLKVSYYIHDNLYKYTVGNFNDFEKTVNELEKIRNLGFADAFIVAFNNNERISIKDAIELLHNE